jgi:sterol desaturase/sphingolipid hydroxylase (fatty acid hydroxylase superfamily)
MSLLALTPECLAAAAGEVPDRRVVSIQVFQNRHLERFLGRAHFLTPIVWFGVPIAWGIARGLTRLGVPATIGLYLSGWLAWTLTEYLLHRFLFHARLDPVRAFLVHGYHHVFPNDRMRLVAPPIMSWGPALIIGLLLRLLLGPNLWLTLFAGMASGYVAYDWIHYYCHHGRPRGGLGKWLRRYHMLHHHRLDHACYGVSSPLWDVVLGTYRATTH